MGPKSLLVNNKHVLKKVYFWKPVNYIMVNLVIFDNPYYLHVIFVATTIKNTFFLLLWQKNMGKQ